jgi:phosphosulfolactate phosphohydrolase-like enzyme
MRTSEDSAAFAREEVNVQIDVVDFVEGARGARGVAVVIDVFRAFSVACYAYDGGAHRMIPFADAEAALALKRANQAGSHSASATARSSKVSTSAIRLTRSHA